MSAIRRQSRLEMGDFLKLFEAPEASEVLAGSLRNRPVQRETVVPKVGIEPTPRVNGTGF